MNSTLSVTSTLVFFLNFFGFASFGDRALFFLLVISMSFVEIAQMSGKRRGPERTRSERLRSEWFRSEWFFVAVHGIGGTTAARAGGTTAGRTTGGGRGTAAAGAVARDPLDLGTSPAQ